MPEPTNHPSTKSTLCYLAGAIEHAPDGGVAWRRDLIPFLRDELGWDVYDPTTDEAEWLNEEEKAHFREWKVSNLPRFRQAVHKIIEKDLGTLRRSDVVICLWDDHVKNGGGTHGEMTVAHTLGMPIHLVLGMPQEKISSWILGCSTEVHEDFEALKAHLRKSLLM